ncbi:MAG: hypothetical protein MUO89_06150 [Dehalococcoidia bacterium]|nr:hypothetical protein [Dehalococcoidia bacterium]
MPLKAAMWVHGTIVEVEYPERLAPVSIDGLVRRGWGTHFWGNENTANWFHIPITTPVILDDIRPPLIKVFVFYKTEGNAKITNIHVYDGRSRVKAFDGLALSGDHSGGGGVDASNSWVVEPPITILYGLGISVGVEFGSQVNIDIPWPEILFTTAGADFKKQP